MSNNDHTFFKCQYESLIVSPRGNDSISTSPSFCNIMTSTMNMPRHFDIEQFSQITSSSTPLRSYTIGRPRNNSYDSNASTIRVADIAEALKNRKFNKHDFRVIKDACEQFMKRRPHGKIEKRRNKQFLKHQRRESDYDSGEAGSVSSISSDDSLSTKNYVYKDSTSSYSNVKRTVIKGNLYKDCTDNFKQNTFNDMLGTAPRYKTDHLQNREPNELPPTQNGRSGFLLPSQGFKQSVASVPIAEKLSRVQNLPSKKNKWISVCLFDTTENDSEIESEQGDIFCEIALRKKNRHKKEVMSQNKRSKVSSPPKNKNNMQQQPENENNYKKKNQNHAMPTNQKKSVNEKKGVCSKVLQTNEKKSENEMISAVLIKKLPVKENNKKYLASEKQNMFKNTKDENKENVNFIAKRFWESVFESDEDEQPVNKVKEEQNENHGKIQKATNNQVNKVLDKSQCKLVGNNKSKPAVTLKPHSILGQLKAAKVNKICTKRVTENIKQTQSKVTKVYSKTVNKPKETSSKKIVLDTHKSSVNHYTQNETSMDRNYNFKSQTQVKGKTLKSPNGKAQANEVKKKISTKRHLPSPKKFSCKEPIQNSKKAKKEIESKVKSDIIDLDSNSSSSSYNIFDI